MFNDDPFENIINEFFGRGQARRENQQSVIQGEEEDRLIDFIEDDKNIYLIFEFPGFNEKDITIIVKGRELQINVKKEITESVQEYLIPKLHKGITINKTLPKIINPKKFSYTIKNGILEIVFNKK